MSGRGRKAVLPPADHRVEPPLDRDGLIVTVINKAGYRKTFDFAELSVAEPMQRSLAAAFAAQARGWNSHLTAGSYWDKLVLFARFVAQLESPPEDLDGLTAAILKRWRARHVASNTGRHTLAVIRRLLRWDPRLAAGPAAEELAKRVPGVKPSRQSYKETERDQVVLAARRQFRAAWIRIRENTARLESWRAGDLAEGSREWRIGQVLDHLARNGDVPRTILPSGDVYATNRHLLGGASAEKSWGRLFLTRMELTALAVVLTDTFAWNLSVYDRMPAPTQAPSAGETTSVTYQVQVEKRRAGGGRWFSTENITDSGADSRGRLVTHALEATAHGRILAARLKPGTGLLMVARAHQPGREDRDLDRPRRVGPLTFGVSDDDAKRWGRLHGLGGSPFQRSRRTTVTREGRPLQHTHGTHESVYMLPDKQVQQASRGVFEAGAREALEQARSVLFGGQIVDEPNPDHQETAMVDCENEETSPWPSPEGGCGADFLLCLACRNAHVHPGHHPRLAHLHQQLHSLRSVLDDRTFQGGWNDHLLRLEDLRDKVGLAAWQAALAQVGDDDRAVVQLLLKGDLAP
ncbi:hypothetical protein SAZ_30365 [Streptomyces noursei ZPM]|uniref:Uncharacterized protein n=1 Tax=Streptomyces noursei TaxID=1971 RepID=A0A401R8A1_STRNR|nr:hypothetical protein [Streptomyces noursei]AKA06281.1 hypothetical protein SAZ_30365 [Streptomyces noursei ZPM]EOT03702.1 hypothetical protein K530_12287 [Streptomyces noursei CCRC 11814]EXU87275.1 hypothetical protein P354_37185 [Streptomyces noursei PD-1]UWS74663.1 hypothetical protein N1H47_27515 [Streptomyces noursei]GCB93859.1 hypothetical protein SALB_06650 [Streptomyces noursei]